MKIKMSKIQWEGIGKQTGWTRTAQPLPAPATPAQPSTSPAPAPAQRRDYADKNYAGMNYNALVQAQPMIKTYVDWLALAIKNRGRLTPDQEKGVRATQSNLQAALKALGCDSKSYPEIMSVLETPRPGTI